MKKGKPKFTFVSAQPVAASSKVLQRVAKFLDQEPAGTLYDNIGIAAKLGYSHSHIKDRACVYPTLKAYKVMIGRKWWWGSPATITAALADPEIPTHE